MVFSVPHARIVSIMLLTFLVIGCSTDKVEDSQTGFLEGKVLIGPLCPVETIPPDPACEPTEATYAAWPLAVWTADKTEKITELAPNAAGEYKVALPAGSYLVDLEKPHLFAKSVPETIEVRAGETTVLNIDIDTGIR